MSKLITVKQPAPLGAIYSKTAFSNSVGKIIPMNMPDGCQKQCTLTTYEIVDKGSAALMTFEIL